MVFSSPAIRQRIARGKASAQAAGRLTREALQPVYYLEYGVPDTFEGRSRLVTVMTAIACARIAAIGGQEAGKLAEALNRRILDEFDAAFREKGVGDASIARKVRKLAEGHSGIGRALMQALDVEAPDARAAAVGDVIRRNGLCAAGHEDRLGAAILELKGSFDAQPDTEIMAGAFACGGNSSK